MEQISKQLLQNGFELPDNVSVGPLEDMPEKVIQFGEGNFLRAFVDWMVDGLNEEGLFGGKVVVVQPIKMGLGHLLNQQDGLYTLMLRGLENGQIVDRRRIVTSISRAVNPYENWRQVLDVARQPEIRYVVSNTTEAGIVYQECPEPDKKCPETFPAKLTAMLFERFCAFDGDPSKGVVVLPCELIEQNGSQLRRCVLKHAHDWGLNDGFETWIKEHCHFCNTLVDRIVPGYPRQEDVKLAEELGYQDKLMDAGEPFHLWVIEGPQEFARELPFDKLGMNVVWTDDMTPYRTRKVRILNGAHTSSVLGAYVAGLDTVGEMMDDDTFSRFLNKAIFEEIVPTLDMDRSETESFGKAVMERFRNPFIKHQLLSISLNSVSKWKVRVLPSLLEYYKKNNQFPAALTFSLAALIRFYQGDATDRQELRGTRGTEHYSICDDLSVLNTFEKRWLVFDRNHDLRALVSIVLSNVKLWGDDLTIMPGFIDAVTTYLQSILINGPRKTLESLVLNNYETN